MSTVLLPHLFKAVCYAIQRHFKKDRNNTVIVQPPTASTYMYTTPSLHLGGHGYQFRSNQVGSSPSATGATRATR